MDERELKLLEQEARKRGTDRSKLMREAVRRYLGALAREATERQYLESYRKQPQELREIREWAKIQAWPAE